MDDMRRYVAEFLSTLLLVFIGVGATISARETGGVIVVALAFGFIAAVLVYTVGPLSGAHANPAITLGVLMSGKISVAGAVAYWIAQFLGATVASLLLWWLTRWGGVLDQSGTLGTNGYGEHINLGGTILLEIMLTFMFVLVVLVVTSRPEYASVAGLAVGFALAAALLAGITLDGTSVNPARSFGPAIFEGGTALRQLWVFIVSPLIGAALAALVAPLILKAPTPYPQGMRR